MNSVNTDDLLNIMDVVDIVYVVNAATLLIKFLIFTLLYQRKTLPTAKGTYLYITFLRFKLQL